MSDELRILLYLTVGYLSNLFALSVYLLWLMRNPDKNVWGFGLAIQVLTACFPYMTLVFWLILAWEWWLFRRDPDDPG